MKLSKSLVLASVLFSCTGASLASAAANPFEDIPKDHWANEAVAKLQADGVLDGYGDGTFRGEQPVTRYEIAQAVAKAMAKKDVAAADKAVLDKLAAEFADELGSLGVRVAAIEKKTSNIKFRGFLRYDRWNERHSTNNRIGLKGMKLNHAQFEFDPEARINQNWRVVGRIELWSDLKSSANIPTESMDSRLRVNRFWAEGRYGHTMISLGKFPWTTELDRGHMIGQPVSGAQVKVGNRLRATLTAGRLNDQRTEYPDGSPWENQKVGSIQGFELDYDFNKRLSVGAAFVREKNGSWNNPGKPPVFWATPSYDGSGPDYGADNRRIWTVGSTYKLGKLWSLNAAYARNTDGNWEARYNTAYTLELRYGRGRIPEFWRKGSLGGFIAYRQFSRGATLQPEYIDVYNFFAGSMRGWHGCVAYALDRNVLGTLLYFRGKDLMYSGDKNMSVFYGSLHFWFY